MSKIINLLNIFLPMGISSAATAFYACQYDHWPVLDLLQHGVLAYILYMHAFEDFASNNAIIVSSLSVCRRRSISALHNNWLVIRRSLPWDCESLLISDLMT